VSRDGAPWLDAGNFQVPASGRWQAAPLAERMGQQVKLGVRPEHVELLAVNERPATAPGDPEPILGQVEVLEFHGSETYLFVSSGTHMLLFRTDPKVHVKIGEQVYFRFQMERAHLFDVQTEARIEERST
jgi:ABC-type sugar transport system ATPase subunit